MTLNIDYLPTPSTEWLDYESYFRDLETTDLSLSDLNAWLKAWSNVEKLIRGLEIQLKLAAYADLTDEAAQKAFDRYSEHLLPNVKNANHVLKEKFLEAVREKTPNEFTEMVKTFEAESRLFVATNVPLLAKHGVLSERYGRLMGSLKTQLGEKEVSYGELAPQLEGRNRNLAHHLFPQT